MIEVYKDILNPAEYEVLETTFTSDEFSWYFSPHHLDSKFNPEEPDNKTADYGAEIIA